MEEGETREIRQELTVITFGAVTPDMQVLISLWIEQEKYVKVLNSSIRHGLLEEAGWVPEKLVKVVCTKSVRTTILFPSNCVTSLRRIHRRRRLLLYAG